MQRVLFLCYDSGPITKQITALAKSLLPKAEIAVLVQFPQTLKHYRRFGINAGLIRAHLGWEHGAIKSEPNGSERVLGSETGFEHLLEYEFKLAPANKTAYLSSATMIASRFSRLCDELSPTLIFVWNGSTLPWSVCADVAKKKSIPVFFLERGFFRNSLFIDAKGVNAKSAFYENRTRAGTKISNRNSSGSLALKAELRRTFRPVVDDNCTRDFKTRADFARFLGVKSDTVFILLPEQLDADTNIILHSKLFPTNKTAIDFILGSLDENLKAKCTILYKRHPEGNVKEPLEENDNLKTIQMIGLEELFRFTDIVVTRTSSLGFEALLFDKPLFVLGNPIYSRQGCTIDIDNQNQFRARLLEEIDSGGVNSNRESAFLGLLESLYSQNHFFGEGQNLRDSGLINQIRVEELIGAGTAPSQGHNPLSLRKPLQELSWGARLLCRTFKNRLLGSLARSK